MEGNIRPPRQEEMQYAADVIHGKRSLDTKVMLGVTIFGAIFGLAVGIAGNISENRGFDLVFILICIGACAFCLFIISALVMASIRTIQAICRSWKPARVLVIIACALFATRWLGNIALWILVPSRIMADLVLGLMSAVFVLLLGTIVLRFIYFIRCLIAGEDDEETLSKSIATSNEHKDNSGLTS